MDRLVPEWFQKAVELHNAGIRDGGVLLIVVVAATLAVFVGMIDLFRMLKGIRGEW